MLCLAQNPQVGPARIVEPTVPVDPAGIDDPHTPEDLPLK